MSGGDLDGFVRELLAAAVSAHFDPGPIRFTQADEAGVRVVRDACVHGAGSVVRLRRPLNRNAFLLGCFNVTAGAPVERVIAGFGWRKGSTTTVAAVATWTGSAGAVGIPRSFLSDAQGYFLQDRANEVILYHNHPANVVNALFDNEPLASGTDRATLVNLHQNPLVLVKTLFGGGRFRFYLGENGYVREFRMPDILRLLAGAGGRR
ncbi:MAG: hypothetical protein HY905_08850 [Deltaproteobacteria bacterium]|nr:hypothetical protein [Deltaproteobacteria bacterium]